MKKIFLGLSFVLFATVANAACPAGSTCTVYDGTYPYTVTGGTQANSDTDRFGKFGPVNATEFGTITINSAFNAGQAAANRTAIQASLDYAASQSRQVVQLPCGVFWIDQPLFVDVPANRQSVTGTANNGSGLVRLSVASTAGWTTGNQVTSFLIGGTTEANGQWTITVVDATHVDLQGSAFSNAWTSGGTIYNPISFGFSSWLKGCGGPDNVNNYGTVIKAVSNLNAPYVIFGPGNGVGGEGFTVLGSITGAACPQAYPAQSIAIAYAAGSGGGHSVRIEQGGCLQCQNFDRHRMGR